MTPVNGAGGYLTVFRDGDVSPDPATRRFHVGRWALAAKSQATDVSNASVSGSRYAHVQGDASWSCELPLDDDLYPEAAGLRRGDIVYIWFKLGVVNKFHNLLQTTVLSVDYETNSTGDVVRVQVTGAGGSLNESVNDAGPVTVPPVGPTSQSLQGGVFGPANAVNQILPGRFGPVLS